MYPPELVMPMAKELNDVGVESMASAADVQNAISNTEGTVLVVVNSVCGCAAANARPAVRMALNNDKTPTKSITVFAGVDREATATAREFMLPYPPSSPSIALFKNGQLVHMLERHHIEGFSADQIATNLKAAFDENCV